MSLALKYNWPFYTVVAVLIGLTCAFIAPYDWNASSLFHIDTFLEDQHPMPPDTVVLDVPSYDGAQYYQIARNIPAIIDSSKWTNLTSLSPGSYAYQRFLLPVMGFVLALGEDSFLPYSFLAIQLLSIGAVAWFTLRSGKKPLYVLALALCPAAIVGLHFSLAEPLTLLLLTAFLLRYSEKEKIYLTDALLLSAITLTREVNILFIGALLLYVLWKQQWKNAIWLIVPMISFFLLHWLIYSIFAEIPFLMSAEKRTLPFEAMAQLLAGGYGYNRLTLTSIPLALLFVIPAFIWTLYLFITGKDRSFTVFGSILFLLLMTMMPDHIWGSITSIGRVITPVYPLTILTMAKANSRTAQIIAASILIIGLGAGMSLATVVHPHHLS